MKHWRRSLGSSLGSWLGSLCALAWLVAVAVVPLPYDHVLWPDQLGRLQPDLVLLFAVAVIGSMADRPRSSAHLAAALLLLSTLTRAADTISRVAFGREFRLGDVVEIKALFEAWLNADPEWLQWTWIGGVAVGLVMLQWLTASAFHRCGEWAHKPTVAVGLLVGLQALVVAAFVVPQVTVPSRQVWHSSPLLKLGEATVRGVRFWLDPEPYLRPMREQVALGVERMASAPAGLERLERADVHIIVIESYGRMALRHPELAPHFAQLWAELGRSLREAGFSARTGAGAPSILGGASGLAHAELLTGVRVPDKETREMLMKSDLVPMPRRFQAAGYRTVEVSPEMPWHWREGDAFYGIDASLVESDLAYRGFVYHFGSMPDQFALHHVLRRVVEPAEQPLFMMFVGVSSHAPWSTVPPYIDDWQIDDRTFVGGPAQRHPLTYQNFLNTAESLPAYRDALSYSLRSTVGYMQRLPRPSLVIVLGDHQPPIARSFEPLDFSRDVPIHVFANRPELLQPLAALGFVDGVILPEDFEALLLSEFAPAFLRAYSR